jgi:hypothetical protein
VAQGTCSIEECQKPVRARGWCATHWSRWQRTGTPHLLPREPREPRQCSVAGCSRPHWARTWCNMHYRRWKANGDPTVSRRLRWPETLTQRMEPQPNGCIHFTGPILDTGYGLVWNGTKQQAAHRAAYEFFVGPIPEGYTIDHECHNADLTCRRGNLCPHRRCINPEHLTPKPLLENWRAARARLTHCKRGHPFNEENTYWHLNAGYWCRQCKQCKADLQRLRKRDPRKAQ